MGLSAGSPTAWSLLHQWKIENMIETRNTGTTTWLYWYPTKTGTHLWIAGHANFGQCAALKNYLNLFSSKQLYWNSLPIVSIDRGDHRGSILVTLADGPETREGLWEASSWLPLHCTAWGLANHIIGKPFPPKIPKTNDPKAVFEASCSAVPGLKLVDLWRP